MAKKALRVQSAFLFGALLGLVMIAIGRFRLYRAFTRATTATPLILPRTSDNKTMHAKPDLRLFLK
jgi:hypothetical protein